MQTDEHDEVIASLERAAKADVCPDATKQAIANTRKALIGQLDQTRSPSFRQAFIMVSRTAAVLVPVTAIIIWLWSSNVESLAFAEVKAKVAATESVSFQTQIERGKNTIVIRTMLLGPHKERKILANGEIAVRDLAKGVSLQLDPQKRTSVRTRFKPAKQVNLYDRIRNIDEGKAERLEGKKLNDQTVAGFRVVDKQEYVTVETTIWADPKSKLPVQIERLWIAPDGKRAAKETLSDFVFDKKLDESLFSLAIPEGYSVEERKGLQDVYYDPNE